MEIKKACKLNYKTDKKLAYLTGLRRKRILLNESWVGKCTVRLVA